MRERIEKLICRFAEVEALLGDPSVFSDQKRYKELAQEHSYLSEIRDHWLKHRNLEKQLQENEELLDECSDEELQQLIREDLHKLRHQLEESQAAIEALLVPPSPYDDRNTILELRAGTGGDEAALFVADMARMYHLYATIKGWKVEILSCSPSDLGGFRDYVVAVSGKGVYRLLQYEAGTHRVQRVPETETQGRVHTSAVTVAVLMEPDEEEAAEVDEKDLKIDTYRASGAGGQHVNTTDSAVRITHIPTGVVVYCQEERSQHKNKAKALRLLVAQIAEQKRVKAERERAELRQNQVGSGDRSERIRTYNFPQNRLTDHRIGLTLYKLDQIMEGALEEITQALVSYFYQQKLSS